MFCISLLVLGRCWRSPDVLRLRESASGTCEASTSFSFSFDLLVVGLEAREDASTAIYGAFQQCLGYFKFTSVPVTKGLNCVSESFKLCYLYKKREILSGFKKKVLSKARSRTTASILGQRAQSDIVGTLAQVDPKNYVELPTFCVTIQGKSSTMQN